MAHPTTGHGLGADHLAHQPDLEKGAECCDSCCSSHPTRRTWRQWARRNDCCFAQNNTAGTIFCAPWTIVKWFVVGTFMIPLFLIHLSVGLLRFFAGGALHMLCRVYCHNKNNLFLTTIYYIIGSPPLLINYLTALLEMLLFTTVLIWAFFAAFSLSLFNALCAIEVCIELIAISDRIYQLIFENTPIALEHPGKLVAPCAFGPAYKSDNAPVTSLADHVDVPQAAAMPVTQAVVTGVPVHGGRQLGASGSHATADPKGLVSPS